MIEARRTGGGLCCALHPIISGFRTAGKGRDGFGVKSCRLPIGQRARQWFKEGKDTGCLHRVRGSAITRCDINTQHTGAVRGQLREWERGKTIPFALRGGEKSANVLLEKREVPGGEQRLAAAHPDRFENRHAVAQGAVGEG